MSGIFIRKNSAKGSYSSSPAWVSKKLLEMNNSQKWKVSKSLDDTLKLGPTASSINWVNLEYASRNQKFEINKEAIYENLFSEIQELVNRPKFPKDFQRLTAWYKEAGPAIDLKLLLIRNKNVAEYTQYSLWFR